MPKASLWHLSRSSWQSETIGPADGRRGLLARVFISHSSKDETQASGLITWLASVGFEQAFLDFDKHAGIAPGEDWERRLYHELERAQAMILILTSNWFESKWCFAEFTQGRALGKAIFALIEAPTGETSIVSSDIQHLDLTANLEEGLERLRRELEKVALDAQGGFDWEDGRAPYPGLLSFEPADAAVFFGRDDDVRRLIERVNARRVQGGAKLIVILGGSGSGKSSLMKAGLLPRLKRDRAHFLVAPSFRPGAEPLRSLVESLRTIDITLTEADLDITTPEGGRALIDRLRRQTKALQATLIIAVDQAEEVFSRAPPRNSEAFFRTLSMLTGGDNAALAILALRADHLPDLQTLQTPGATLPEIETFPLKPMPVERIGLLVEGPARVAGITVEQGLATAIMRDAYTTDALPLAAFVLRRLYDRHGSCGHLGLVHYESLRDGALSPLEAAIRDAAKEALDSARPAPSPDEIAALREAFVPAMVRVNDEGGFVRQPARRDLLPKAAHRLIERLVDARLLALRQEISEQRHETNPTTAKSDEPSRDPTLVEVAHEAIFRVWPMLAAWLEAEREFLIGKSRIERAREDFAKLAENERAKAHLSGILLERAKNWLIAHPARFTPEETTFIQASVAEADRQAAERAAERERLRQAELAQARAETERAQERAVTAKRWQRRSIFAAAIFLVVAVLAGISAVYAVNKRNEAEQQTARAEAQTKLAEEERAEAQRQTERAEAQTKLAEQQRTEAEREKKIADGNFVAAKQAVDGLIFDVVQNLRNIGGMRIDTLRKILDSVKATVDALVKNSPNDAQLLRSQSAMLDEFVPTYLAAGDVDRAREAAEQSVAITRQLVLKDPSAFAKRDQSISLDRVGNVKLQLGDGPGALVAYEESLTIRRELVAQSPKDARARRDLSVSLEKVGDVKALNDQNATEALAAYQESLDIRRKLVDEDKASPDYRRDVSVSLEKIGDMRLKLTDREGALAAYQECLDIRRKLVDEDQNNVQLQRDVSVIFEKLGDMKIADKSVALDYYAQSLVIARRLATDTSSAELQVHLVLSLWRVASASPDPGPPYRECVEILEKLERAGKITAEQRNWLKRLRDQVAKLSR
jgi:tetratricopeptide (TPR) repeat protein